MSKPTLPDAPDQAGPFIPPLEMGDHLSREEFRRRYQAMPEVKKAELIEGVVYMPSPVRQARHGLPHTQLVTWLGTYMAHTPGVMSGDNSTVQLDENNEPQPDALLFIAPDRGGQARLTADDYIDGAPELAAEIAASRVSYDANIKLEVYRRNGVREYLLWRVLDGQFDWFVLRDGQYVLLPAGQDGITRSEVFPGLWLDTAALLAGDTRRVLEVLGQGIASPEHAAFVARLNPPPAP
jgi:Uma2 family endonuclease